MSTSTRALAAACVALALSCDRVGAAAGPAEASVCEAEMARAARKYGVPLGVLYAVGLTETGRRGSLRPWAMNIDGRAILSDTRAAALAQHARARRDGAKLIDIGCLQINQKYHGAHFASTADMFDPARNVDYGARFLRSLRTREGSWTMAIARYHAGPDNDPAQKRYVCAVIRNMVAVGFGAWTPASRAFCRAGGASSPK